MTLQVRQGHVLDRSFAEWTEPGRNPAGDEDLAVRWGGWMDVGSPAWLQGFILAQAGFVYEFRLWPDASSENPAPRR